MKICWKKLSTTVLFWLFSEILLNCLGLDNLADYGEFIGKQSLSLNQFEHFRHS